MWTTKVLVDREALTEVVNYLLEDEKKDYQANPKKGHIYLSVKILQAALHI